MPFASAAATKLARRDADVDVEIAEIDAVERVGQREQRADLVDPAERAAAAPSARPTRERRAFLLPGATARARLPWHPGMDLLERVIGGAAMLAHYPRFVAALRVRFALLRRP